MGFKLETEENILKSIEMTKAQEKKLKQAQKLNQQIGRRSSNKFGQLNKLNYITKKVIECMNKDIDFIIYFCLLFFSFIETQNLLLTYISNIKFDKGQRE